MPAEAPDRVGPFLVAKLRALGDRIGEVAPRVLASEDEEAVHDLRVAIRRARTALEVGSDVLGPFRANEVRRALRDVQRATGALRDEEVMLELVGSLGIHRRDVQAWIEARQRRERRLRSALRRSIRAGAVDRGRTLLDALLAFRINPSKERRLTKTARRAVDDAREELERIRGAPVDSPEALHRLRIAYKRLRYTVETFIHVLPGPARELAQSASKLQARLGDVHDADVAMSCVRRARTLTDSARAALLAGLQHVRDVRFAAYCKDIAPPPRPEPPLYASGAVALRKTSTR
jgi:CHAD domain-containing protein